MSFRLGQTVVHPHHGAAVIDEVEEREWDGEPAEYLVLQLADESMTLRVPTASCENLGIREVIGPDEAEEIFEVLAQDPDLSKGNWSRKLKRNRHRTRSGDPGEVAAVVRDLRARNQHKPLSPAEKRLLDNARAILAGELAAALDCGVEHVAERIERSTQVDVDA